MDIKITSPKRGSNPGGNCDVTLYRGNSFEGYFKYCAGNKLPTGIEFRPENQPVYEAITLQLANRFGLHIPSTYVLLNGKRDVTFVNEFGEVDTKHSGRDCYFISQLIDKKRSIREGIATEIIEDEIPYLDALLIDDVKNKPHNYLLQKDKCGFRVVYLDVGCSFTRATEGNLSVSNIVKKVLSSRNHKNDIKRLKHKLLVAADDSDLVDLEELVSDIGNLEIPVLNPFSKKKVFDLISSLEIEQMQKCLAYSIAHNISEFKSRGLIEVS